MMERENLSLPPVPPRRTQRMAKSRRDLLVNGAIASLGVAGAVGLQALLPDRSQAAAPMDKQNDVKVLNGALFYEHQAIWAYSFAAGKLTTTAVGKAVLAIALANQADHKQHRDVLASAIRSLGGTPVTAQASYDLSGYLKKGEGNIDSDVNIAKLALALETDAAIAYTQEVSRLKTPALITAGASIGATEASHATVIRAAFKSLGVSLEVVPAAFVSAQNRDRWILTV